MTVLVVYILSLPTWSPGVLIVLTPRPSPARLRRPSVKLPLGQARTWKLRGPKDHMSLYMCVNIYVNVYIYIYTCIYTNTHDID